MAVEEVEQEVVVKMIDKLFKKAINNNLCNTSYPLKKELWNEYKNNNIDLFEKETDLCLYIHIPFCEKLCSFCEYIKFKKDNNMEKRYLEILQKDIENFIENHTIKKIYGFDIGGGTPTSLNIESFKKLMEISKIINHKLPHSDDYEASIEATFNTIEEEKIRLIKDAGFKRISLGIQTINTKILLENNRDIVSIKSMIDIINLIKKNDIKVNLDLMYGLPNQKKEDIENSIKIIKILNPHQITLYEMRYNMVNLKQSHSKEKLCDFYTIFYNCFIKIGYNGNFGQNTFSKSNDLGLSSYLKNRMINNVSYKGFGISAQSKSKLGISYNIGKKITTFDVCTHKNTFYEEDNYILPKEEMLAKYVAISLYYGKFKLSIMKEILNEDPIKKFKLEFNYLLSNRYIEIVDDFVCLTKLGFKYYGAIGALFYSEKSKKLIMGE